MSTVHSEDVGGHRWPLSVEEDVVGGLDKGVDPTVGLGRDSRHGTHLFKCVVSKASEGTARCTGRY